jgi:phage I-like protein
MKDVDKFKKGLTSEKKKKWVSIANSVLKQCIKDGGAELECEVKAIRTANARIDNKDESELSKYVLSNNFIFDRNEIDFICAEANQDEYQLAFPIGLFNTSKYGEVIITRTFADYAVKNWKTLMKTGRNIWMDTQHDFGAANAWAENVIADDDGIKVKWDFTPKGKKLIEDKEYKYYSSAIMKDVDIETGKELYPVLEAVSLTNCPVMYTMPGAHLDKSGKDTHSDVDIKNKNMEVKMTIEEILKAIKEGEFDLSKITDEQKTVIVEKFGIEIPEKKEDDKKKKEDDKKLEDLNTENETLKDVNKALSGRLSKIEKANHEKDKKEIIENSIKEGKIDVKDREVWEQRFDKNPDSIKEILETLPQLHDFKEVGKAGNQIKKMSGNDPEYAKAFDLDEEDYKNFSDSSKPVKKEDNK